MGVWLKVYFASAAILLAALYSYERAKARAIPGRAILVMAEMAALFSLVPATVYVLFSGLLRTGR